MRLGLSVATRWSPSKAAVSAAAAIRKSSSPPFAPAFAMCRQANLAEAKTLADLAADLMLSIS